MKTIKYKGQTYRLALVGKPKDPTSLPEGADLGRGNHAYIATLKDKKEYEFLADSLRQAWIRAWKKWGRNVVKNVEYFRY